MKISGNTIRSAISDAGMVITNHQSRAEGEVFIVKPAKADGTPDDGPASFITLREPEMHDQFTVFGRIQHAARSLRPDD